MSKLTLLVGAVLIATGLVAYVASSSASVTALIPSIVGLVLVVCGLVARDPSRRRVAVHAALAVAVLATVGSVMNVVQIGDLVRGDAERPGAVVASTVMFVVLALYVVAGVRSFRQARQQL